MENQKKFNKKMRFLFFLIKDWKIDVEIFYFFNKKKEELALLLLLLLFNFFIQKIRNFLNGGVDTWMFFLKIKD